MNSRTKVKELNETDEFGDSWNAVLSLVNKSVSQNEYHFYLYLLILQSEGVLKDIKIENSINITKSLKEAILNFKGENSDQLIELFEFIEPIINQVEANVLKEILFFHKYLDTIALKEGLLFSDIFDISLEIFNKWQSRNGSEYILPRELCEFLCDLANLSKDSKVYNPFAGFASFGVFLNNESSYFGQEFDRVTKMIGVMRLIAYKKGSKSKLVQGNSVQHWNPDKEKYDLIIAYPPIGLRLPSSIVGDYGSINSCENFLIEKGISDLNKEGKLIAVISRRFLFISGHSKNLRKFLIESDLLETIISFPKGLLSYNVPIAVLVINKSKNKTGYVQFVDASQAIENLSKREKRLNAEALKEIINKGIDTEAVNIVSNKAISEFDFSLNTPFYFESKINGILLKEILSPISGKRSEASTAVNIVRIRDLKSNKMDFNLTLDSQEEMPLFSNAKKIQESALLIALRWNTLKPTHFNYTGTPIFISNDIAAFRIDKTKVDVGFLVNILYSSKFIDLTESIRTGATIPALSIQDFLNLQIELPPIENQLDFVSKEKESFIAEKLKEVEDLKRVIGIESEVENQNNFLRHSIAGNMANLRGAFKRIKNVFENQIKSAFPNYGLLKDDGNSDLTIDKLLKMMERDIDKISQDIQRNSAERNLTQAELTQIEILPFLKNYVTEVRSRTNLKFEIFLIGNDIEDEEGNRVKVFINGNERLMKDMLNNIIENAEVHAFDPIDTEKNKIEITVWIYTEGVPVISISISNTGKRLPKEFNGRIFETKGSRAGMNAGNGFGGWYISQIIKKHGGKFEIDDEQGYEGIGGIWATSFEIQLPVLNFESYEAL